MTTPSTSPSPETDTPIAIYREKYYRGNRQFDLFPDRVRVRGSLRLRYDYDMIVLLDTLHPQAARFWIRDSNFITCLVVLGFMLSLLALLFEFRDVIHDRLPFYVIGAI